MKKKGIIVLFILFIIAVAGFFTINHFYKKVYAPAVSLTSDSSFFHIPSGSDFTAVKNKLYREGKIGRAHV